MVVGARFFFLAILLLVYKIFYAIHEKSWECRLYKGIFHNLNYKNKSNIHIFLFFYNGNKNMTTAPFLVYININFFNLQFINKEIKKNFEITINKS